ncbi:hypothetical protein Taro_037614 [Colocasia esculenta]|uniref:Neprosin PEP catalytic domain-containing protein n=1 Tax=Colocasia esculenta TaxID=4460 RepID=A0A843WDC0_COLES|nr:hypothetical protein [Colocasia esculenta]
MATHASRSSLVLFALCIAFHHHAVVVDAARSMLASPLKSPQVPRPLGIRGSLGPAGQLSAVSPSLYGDTRTRLFTHWTTRNDWSNGCYNSQCDRDTGDWWLYYQDHAHKSLAIGHWPKQLFTSLAENADSVMFGGEVFFNKDDDKGPPMGNGYLGIEQDKAASFTEMQHTDIYGNFDYFSIDDMKFYLDNEACYNTMMTQGSLGVLFFYGGPDNVGSGFEMN